ncbi:hypothetical protein HanIR_Chr03g0111361 [Helianthus annuus]|nr:hypothetical protein HanIR_Chr03g0111361 [Helianthus annuus]
MWPFSPGTSRAHGKVIPEMEIHLICLLGDPAFRSASPDLDHRPFPSLERNCPQGPRGCNQENR